MEVSVHGAQTDLKSVANRKVEGSIPLASAKFSESIDGDAPAQIGRSWV